MFYKRLRTAVLTLALAGLCLVPTSAQRNSLNRKVAAKMLRPYVAGFVRTDDVNISFRLLDNTTTETLKKQEGPIGTLTRLEYLECTLIPGRVVPPSYLHPGYTIPDQCDITLTKKGLEASVGWKVERHWEGNVQTRLSRLRIPVGRGEFIAVTGIREDNQNLRTVFFTYWYKPMNDIGEELVVEEEELQGVAYFRKFDDGWRIVPVSQIY